MKKYISAILVNALLLQFAGCYTQREITYEEFYSLPKLEDIIVETKTGGTIDLYSDSLQDDYIKWEKSEDAVTFYPTHLEKYSSTALIEKTDTVRYPKEDIAKIFVDEYDESKTLTAILVPIGIIAFIITIGIITYEPPSIDW